MLREREVFTLWRSYVFRRNRHPAFDALLRTQRLSSGVYLLGCAGKIIYVGQSVELDKRSIQSLGTFYHRVQDVALPWSIAYAPCPADERNERESTAIRAFAPEFNTSIPSEGKSQLRMPEITAITPVFMDQEAPCGAFVPENMERQMRDAAIREAEHGSIPNWKRRKPRKPDRREKLRPVDTKVAVDWTKDDSDQVVRQRGTPANGDLPFKINLCNDGSVITRDGEFIGTWQVDECAHPSFTPEGASTHLLYHPFMPMLCEEIARWYEETMGEPISEKVPRR